MSWNQGPKAIVGSTTFPINSVLTAVNTDRTGAYGSQHAGEAQFLLGDGAVRFISENVNLTTDNGPDNSWPVDSILEALVGIGDGVPVGDF